MMRLITSNERNEPIDGLIQNLAWYSPPVVEYIYSLFDWIAFSSVGPGWSNFDLGGSLGQRRSGLHHEGHGYQTPFAIPDHGDICFCKAMGEIEWEPWPKQFCTLSLIMGNGLFSDANLRLPDLLSS